MVKEKRYGGGEKIWQRRKDMVKEKRYAEEKRYDKVEKIWWRRKDMVGEKRYRREEKMW